MHRTHTIIIIIPPVAGVNTVTWVKEGMIV